MMLRADAVVPPLISARRPAEVRDLLIGRVLVGRPERDHQPRREIALHGDVVSDRPLGHGRRGHSRRLAIGKALTSDLIATMSANAAGSVDPIDDVRGPVDYKRHLVGVLTRRALQTLADGNVVTNS